MTSERAEAYGRLMRRLRNPSGPGLQPHEEQQVREAADALLFCDGDRTDEQTLDALEDAVRMIEGLVRVGRWRDGAARRLLRDLEACGPLTPVS
jgi:hypothetical protein